MVVKGFTRQIVYLYGRLRITLDFLQHFKNCTSSMSACTVIYPWNFLSVVGRLTLTPLIEASISTSRLVKGLSKQVQHSSHRIPSSCDELVSSNSTERI